MNSQSLSTPEQRRSTAQWAETCPAALEHLWISDSSSQPAEEAFPETQAMELLELSFTLK